RAVILHTRSFKRGGLWGWRARTVVEITAREEDKGLGSRVSGLGSDSRTRSARKFESSSRPTDKRVAPIQETLDPRPQTPDPSFRLSTLDPLLLSEIETIRRMVGDVLAESRRGKLPDLPEDLLDMYTRLVGQQVADEIARRLVEDVRASVEAEGLESTVQGLE